MSVFFIFSFPFLKLDITILSLFMLIWKLSFIHSLLSSTIFHIWPMENYSRVVSNRCSLITIIFNIGNSCKKVFFLCFFQLFSPHYHRFCLLFWFFSFLWEVILFQLFSTFSIIIANFIIFLPFFFQRNYLFRSVWYFF